MSKETEMIALYVPCYNMEKYIRRCLESICKQSYRNLEIIVIDNNSNDNSLDIINEMAGTDSRIKVLQCFDSGIASVRNMAISKCTGEWIINVDADDYVEEDYVSCLYEEAKKNNADMVCSSYYLTDVDGSTKRAVHLPELSLHGSESIQKYFMTTGRNFSQSWGKLVKRELFDGIVYPEGKLYEDIAVIHKLCEKMELVVVKDLHTYAYVQRPDSISYGNNLDKQMQGLDARLNNCSFIEKYHPDLLEIAYDCVLEFAFFLLGKLKKCGIKDNKRMYDNVVTIIRNTMPLAAKKGFSMKIASIIFFVSPYLAATMFEIYSTQKNKTK